MNLRAVLPALAAASFIAGFGVAEVTGVRALGGLVLLAGGVWCARLALRLTGTRQAMVLVGIALALFVLSHPLGHVIGSWPAVVVSAAGTAAMATAITQIWRKTDSPGATG